VTRNYDDDNNNNNQHHVKELVLVTCSNSELLQKLQISLTLGWSPWMGDHPDARPLLPQDSTTQKY
jgi:hypothetical protein